MTGLIAAEIRKLRTVRTTWVLTLIGLALVVLSSSVFVFAEELSGPFGGTDAEVGATVDQIGSNAVIILIVAILVVTTEFRHGTIGRTLQLTPSRTRVLAAKTVTGAIYAVAFFLAGVVVVAAVVAIGAAVKDVPVEVGSATYTALWQGPVGLALNATFGVAIGALLRSQVVTITLTLVWLFVAEQLVTGLLPTVGRWLPFQALNALFLSDEVLANIPEGQMMPLEPTLALPVFLAYVAVAVVAAGVLLRTRDV
jgi:ABC-2 type transport system permease protein